MIFEMTEKAKSLHTRVQAFIEKNVIPNESVYAEQVAEGDRWQPVPIMEELNN